MRGVSALSHPIGLVGNGLHVDAVARALLRDGGDRRALAPLLRAERATAARCALIVACGVPESELRRLARLRVPLVAVLQPGQDRYAVGAIPGLGATRAIPPQADGRLDGDALRVAVARAVDVATADALAARLPGLRPHVERRAIARVVRVVAASAVRGGMSRPASETLAAAAVGARALRRRTRPPDGPARAAG